MLKIILSVPLIILLFILLNKKKRRLDFFVLFISMLLLGAVWNEYFLEELAAIFNVSRGVDVFLYGWGAVSFLLLFYLYLKIDGIERKITELVRKLALNETAPS